MGIMLLESFDGIYQKHVFYKAASFTSYNESMFEGLQMLENGIVRF